MANSNLTSAKKAKNDEFYTQYPDIEKEISAYLMYNPDTFRNKVVYCNCDDPFESNFFKFFVLNFRRLGLKRLITTSYKPSPVANTQLGLFGDDLTIVPEKGRPKVTANKFIITEVGDYDNDGQFNLEDVARQLKENKHNEWSPLEGDGDFRSDECVQLLKGSDIVVTNPPFSLFREYVGQLVKHGKQFCIIGNLNAITYREIFPLIKENKLWLGTSNFNTGMYFDVPNDFTYAPTYKFVREQNGKKVNRVPGVCWFSNLDHGRRHQPLQLMSISDNSKHNKKIVNSDTAYEKYDNYDAIEVPFSDAIPSDYSGIMGVPITFLDKYSPEQFEIIWLAAGNSYANMPKDLLKVTCFVPNVPGSEGAGQGVGVVKRKKVYARVLIKHRKAAA